MRIRNRRRGDNPFATTSAAQSGTPVDPDAGATRADAVAVLGEPLADTAAKVVAANPDLLNQTLSAVRPEDVDTSTVTLLGMIADNSLSALEYMAALGQAHDEIVDAMGPAQHEGVTILSTLSLLDGTVVYPLVRLEDVPRFGIQPEGEIREIETTGKDGKKAMVRVDALGRRVAENGLTYDHMRSRFRMIDHTPVRRCVRDQTTALLAEMVEWQNPRVARTVNVVSVVLTDGFSTRDTVSADELSDFIGEVEGGGFFTALATFIGDVNSSKFRTELEQNIVQNLVPRSERQSVPVEQWVRRFGDRVLPNGHQLMGNEQLMRYWFYNQGLAALEGRLFLPGGDPKAIRRAAGQMSQVAFQASVGAFREVPDVQPSGEPPADGSQALSQVSVVQYADPNSTL